MLFPLIGRVAAHTLNLSAIVKSQADLCVKCGLCLPHCPTYIKTRDEGDSPRGRIALMQALAEDRLPAAGRLSVHLDRCLGCRACERVCPSAVPYGQLIDAGRALESERGTGGPTTRIGRRTVFNHLIPRRGRVGAVARVLRLYQRSGLQRLARRSGVLRRLRLERLDAALPGLDPPAKFLPDYRARGESRGRVALFTGCLGTTLDQQSVRAAIRLLTAVGYDVHVPTAQTCCGALPLHAGELESATALARRNLEALGDASVDAIVYLASGCGATLMEYGAWPPATSRLGGPVRDVCSFLEACEWPGTLRLRPLAGRAVVHDPCSLTNVVRASRAPYRLLQRIPELEVRALEGNAVCCGAAGSYFLTQPDMADTLREDKLEAIRASGAGWLVTSNVGCALHLAAGMQAAGLPIETLHPVTLFERQLEGDP